MVMRWSSWGYGSMGVAWGGGGWTILRTQVSDSPALSVHMISVGLMIYAFRLGLLWNRQLSLLLHTERYAALANLWDPNTLLFFFFHSNPPPPGGPSPFSPRSMRVAHGKSSESYCSGPQHTNNINNSALVFGTRGYHWGFLKFLFCVLCLSC